MIFAKYIRQLPMVKRIYRHATNCIKESEMFYLKHFKPRRMGRVVKKCTVHECVIYIDIEDIPELERARSYSTQEPETIEYIESYIKPNDVFYDIGANIGQYSLYAAKFLDGRCKVYAFEPAFHTYAKLNWNIYLNNLDSVIFAYDIAISDKQEIHTFNIGDMRKGSALHSFRRYTNHEENQLDIKYKQGMLGLPLDMLHTIYRLEPPNHIKIDVDGAEDLVVNGAKETLKGSNLKSVIIEITQIKGTDNYERIINIFKENGFVLVQATHMWESKKSVVWNVVFAREDSRK